MESQNPVTTEDSPAVKEYDLAMKFVYWLILAAPFLWTVMYLSVAAGNRTLVAFFIFLATYTTLQSIVTSVAQAARVLLRQDDQKARPS